MTTDRLVELLAERGYLLSRVTAEDQVIFRGDPAGVTVLMKAVIEKHKPELIRRLREEEGKPQVTA